MDNIKLFAQSVAKKNKKFNKFIIDCIILAAASIYIFEDMPDYVFVLMIGFLIVILTDDFLKKYLFIERRFDETSLCSVIRYHVFFLDAYGRLLAGRIIPVSIVIAIYEIGCGVFLSHIPSYICAALALIIPWLVLLVKLTRFEYGLSKWSLRPAYAIFEIISGLLKGVYDIASFVIIFVGVVLIALVGYGGVIGDISVYGEDVVAYQVYYYSVAYFIMLGIIIFLFVSVIFRRTSYGYILQTIICIAVVIMCIFNGYNNKNNTLIIAEGKIYGVIKGEEYEYEFSDVIYYSVYENDDSIQMKLRMKDGNEYVVFGKDSTFTEAYSEKFWGEYNFAAYLVGEFKELGITGTLDDEEYLLDRAGKDNRKSLDGMEEIISLFN